MLDTLAALCASSLRQPSAVAWRPLLFSLPAQQEALAALLASGEVRAASDTLSSQLEELIDARHPRGISPAEREAARAALTGGDPAHFGVWVFYPWSGRLARVLPEAMYRELRSDRNRYKINSTEQERLRGASIGIVGLSVGQAAAVTLVQEGIGSRFRLADFDTLGLSNMNRLRASAADLGVHKAILAARAMFEIDPFLEIELFPRGLDAETLDPFLDGLSLVLEECDDLALKLLLRERARAKKLPVLMETSDRGLLDIERFDLEPERPLFHGLIGSLSSVALRQLRPEERVTVVIRILGEDQSVGARASLIEMKESLSTWPQLASAISLGAGIVTDAARRVLLGSLTCSGRFSVDLEALVSPQGALSLVPVSLELGPSPAPAPLPALPARGQEGPTPEELHYLVAHASTAPSGGNVQPWRFVWNGTALRAEIDPARGSFLDVDGSASRVALGGAVELLRCAGAALGLRADSVIEEGGFTVRFSRVSPWEEPLAAWIGERCTNRRPGEPRELAPDDLHALLATAEDAGSRLALVTDPAARAALGAVVGDGEAFRFFDARLHQEMMSELRFPSATTERANDGIDVATLELPPAGLATLRLLRDRALIERLAQSGARGGLGRPARWSLLASSAIGMLWVPGRGQEAYLRGGAALARVWLRATQRGLAFQPWSPLLYLVARLAQSPGDFTPEAQATLRGLAEGYRAHFPTRGNETEVLLFRVAYAAQPSARSLRRPVADVLRYQESPPLS